MAFSLNLPRFVKLAKYADFNIENADQNTLYFIAEQGVIYQGSNLVTKSVQTDDSKIPGLFYINGDGNLVTYDTVGAETVVALSPANVSELISDAKDEINGTIGNLTAADIAFDATETTVAKGDDVQAVIEAIDTKLAAIAGGEEGDSLASLGLRISDLEEVTEGYTDKGSIKAAVDGAQGTADQAIADAKKANDAIAAMDSELDATGTAAKGGVFVVSGITQVDGVITAVDSVEVEQAGAASEVEASINKKLGGNFGTEEGQQTVDAAIKAVDAKFASYSTTEQVDGKISAALSSVLKFKGVVAAVENLPTEGMVEGDVYYVTAESKEFVYVDEDGKKGWEELGATVDYAGMLAPYLLIGDTFADGEILVASVDGDAKSAKTTGIKVGGATFEDTPAATTLATEKAVADLLAQMAWQTTM